MKKLLLFTLFLVVVLCLLDGSDAWRRRRRRRRAPPPPKINCAVSGWSSWGPCSKTCGTGGSKSRSRWITTYPTNGGHGCPTLYSSYRCFVQNCPIDCKWTAWGAWSDCNACSTGRSRFRNVSIAAMFRGKPCSDYDHAVSTSCPAAKECPVECPDGQFKCKDGLTCIKSSLRCNGDDDCTDNSDERCDQKTSPCGGTTPSVIPNVYLAGAGFDITDGMTAGQILDNRKYNGRCDKVFSGDHLTSYRRPANIQSYRFQVRVDTSFTTRSYNSAKDYVEEQRKGTEIALSASVSAGIPAFGEVSVKSSFTNNKNTKQVIKQSSNKDAKFFKVTSTVKLAQFSTVRGHLILSHNFRRRLRSLPDHYDFQKYYEVILDYGTHFYSSGTLGGKYEYIYRYSKFDLAKSKLNEEDQKKCLSVEASAKFFGVGTSTGTSHCSSNGMSVQHGSSFTKSAKEEMSVVIGGSSSAAAKLSFSREASEKSYNDWVETVKHNPSIIDYELRPISDVIPDHAKKANMERALFHYMGKYDDAACKGRCYHGAAVVVTDGGESCTCLCKPPYRGVDCYYT